MQTLCWQNSAGKRPVFEYGSITDEIEDPNLTFEQLRVKMSADCPELEARSHVSWTMSYAGITERVSSADAGIYETKAKIEKGKKFKEALKKLKPKDKEPVCAVKPTVTAQKKGVLPFPSYKGLFGSMDQAEQSDKAIAYIPARDGKVYEMRRNEIGTFTAPSLHIAELEDIRAGFQMSLPGSRRRCFRRSSPFSGACAWTTAGIWKHSSMCSGIVKRANTSCTSHRSA